MKLTIIFIAVLISGSCNIMPHNTFKDCIEQCEGSEKSKACFEFCECIHKRGESLNKCKEEYNNASVDSVRKDRSLRQGAFIIRNPNIILPYAILC